LGWAIGVASFTVTFEKALKADVAVKASVRPASKADRRMGRAPFIKKVIIRRGFCLTPVHRQIR
jgi:hypothetical protein